MYSGQQSANSHAGKSNETASLVVEKAKVKAKAKHGKRGKLYPEDVNTGDDSWKDEVLGEGEDVINRFGKHDPEFDDYRPRYEPAYPTDYGATERSVDSEGVGTAEIPGSVESEVGSEQTLESSHSTTTNASGTTSGEGSTTSSTSSDPYTGAAANSGPFGVPIGTWIIIAIVGLFVLIALFFIRKYIRTVVGCLETSCYWTCKAISFPFFLLWSALQAMAYPIKEFCVHTRQAMQEYWHPWSVVT